MGTQPLHFAAANGHEAVTKQLISARCSVDLQTKEAGTPPHLEIGNKIYSSLMLHRHSTRSDAVTKGLIAARYSVDLQQENGFTPLHFAAQEGHESVTTQLLAARCNVDLQANNGYTAAPLCGLQRA
jgi:ankyrin repeat protein